LVACLDPISRSFPTIEQPHPELEHNMTRPLQHILAFLATLFVALNAQAHEAGWMQIQLAGAAPDAAATTVAVYYPTLDTPRVIAMGPFTLNAAVGGKPADRVKALILLSHGIGGTELGHSVLAQALARNGYLVAALRHPGDNWQDRSLVEKSPERYFDERPRQASRVIDAMLADPVWKDRIMTDSRGPRVGALGHSAGGYTVLALVGARPDLSRIRQHCLAAGASEDPIFCSLVRSGVALPVTPEATPSLTDPRVRAIVAMAPTGVPLTAESLATVRMATMIYEAELDRFLVPKFHAEWVAKNLPAPNLQRVPNAWHFAFMDTPSMPIGSPDGDIGANPKDFDRGAFLQRLGEEISTFFDKSLI
jgi:predicted dienelactone hydrolase